MATRREQGVLVGAFALTVAVGGVLGMGAPVGDSQVNGRVKIDCSSDPNARLTDSYPIDGGLRLAGDLSPFGNVLPDVTLYARENGQLEVVKSDRQILDSANINEEFIELDGVRTDGERISFAQDGVIYEVSPTRISGENVIVDLTLSCNLPRTSLE